MRGKLRTSRKGLSRKKEFKTENEKEDGESGEEMINIENESVQKVSPVFQNAKSKCFQSNKEKEKIGVNKDISVGNENGLGDDKTMPETSAFDYNSQEMDKCAAPSTSTAATSAKRKRGTGMDDGIDGSCSRYRRAQQALVAINNSHSLVKENATKKRKTSNRSTAKGKKSVLSVGTNGSDNEEDFVGKPLKKSVQLAVNKDEQLMLPTGKGRLNLRKKKSQKLIIESENQTTESGAGNDENFEKVTELKTSDFEGNTNESKETENPSTSAQVFQSTNSDEEDDVFKEPVSNKSCPVCEKMFLSSETNMQINEHVNSCIDSSIVKEPESNEKGSEMDPRSSVSLLRDQLMAFEYQKSEQNQCETDVELSDELFFCHMCQKDLAKMNSQRRQQHINRCCDKVEQEKSKEVVQKSNPTAVNNKLACPICGAGFKTAKSRQGHVKKCAQKNGVPPQKLIEMMQKERQQETVPASLNTAPSEISAPTIQSTSSVNDAAPGRRKKAATSIKNLDDQTQLAMALSASMAPPPAPVDNDGLTTKTRKRKKKGDQVIPALLLRSKQETQDVIAARAAQIVCSQDDTDDEISCTPALAPSTLAQQFHRVEKANKERKDEPEADQNPKDASSESHVVNVDPKVKDKNLTECTPDMQNDDDDDDDDDDDEKNDDCDENTDDDIQVIRLDKMLKSPDMCKSFLGFLQDDDDDVANDAANKQPERKWKENVSPQNTFKQHARADHMPSLWSLASLQEVKEEPAITYYVPGLLPPQSPMKASRKTPRKDSQTQQSIPSLTNTSGKSPATPNQQHELAVEESPFLEKSVSKPSLSESITASQAINVDILMELVGGEGNDVTVRLSSCDDDQEDVFPSSGFCLPIGQTQEMQDKPTAPSPYLTTLLGDLHTMLYSPALSDVVMVTKGDVEIPAHRFILSARSKVLAEMLEQQESSESNGKFYLRFNDTEEHVVREFLKFIYTATLDAPTDVLDDIAAFGEKLQMPELVKACQDRKLILQKQTDGDMEEPQERKPTDAEELLDSIWEENSGPQIEPTNRQETQELEEGFDDEDIEEIRIFQTQVTRRISTCGVGGRNPFDLGHRSLRWSPKVVDKKGMDEDMTINCSDFAVRNVESVDDVIMEDVLDVEERNNDVIKKISPVTDNPTLQRLIPGIEEDKAKNDDSLQDVTFDLDMAENIPWDEEPTIAYDLERSPKLDNEKEALKSMNISYQLDEKKRDLVYQNRDNDLTVGYPLRPKEAEKTTDTVIKSSLDETISRKYIPEDDEDEELCSFRGRLVENVSDCEAEDQDVEGREDFSRVDKHHNGITEVQEEGTKVSQNKKRNSDNDDDEQGVASDLEELVHSPNSDVHDTSDLEEPVFRNSPCVRHQHEGAEEHDDGNKAIHEISISLMSDENNDEMIDNDDDDDVIECKKLQTLPGLEDDDRDDDERTGDEGDVIECKNVQASPISEDDDDDRNDDEDELIECENVQASPVSDEWFIPETPNAKKKGRSLISVSDKASKRYGTSKGTTVPPLDLTATSRSGSPTRTPAVVTVTSPTCSISSENEDRNLSRREDAANFLKELRSRNEKKMPKGKGKGKKRKAVSSERPGSQKRVKGRKTNPTSSSSSKSTRKGSKDVAALASSSLHKTKPHASTSSSSSRTTHVDLSIDDNSDEDLSIGSPMKAQSPHQRRGSNNESGSTCSSPVQMIPSPPVSPSYLEFEAYSPPRSPSMSPGSFNDCRDIDEDMPPTVPDNQSGRRTTARVVTLRSRSPSVSPGIYNDCREDIDEDVAPTGPLTQSGGRTPPRAVTLRSRSPSFMSPGIYNDCRDIDEDVAPAGPLNQSGGRTPPRVLTSRSRSPSMSPGIYNDCRNTDEDVPPVNHSGGRTPPRAVTSRSRSSSPESSVKSPSSVSLLSAPASPAVPMTEWSRMEPRTSGVESSDGGCDDPASCWESGLNSSPTVVVSRHRSNVTAGSNCVRNLELEGDLSDDEGDSDDDGNETGAAAKGSDVRQSSAINTMMSLRERLKVQKSGVPSVSVVDDDDDESGHDNVNNYKTNTTPARSQGSIRGSQPNATVVGDITTECFDDGGYNCDVDEFAACLEGDDSFMANAAMEVELNMELTVNSPKEPTSRQAEATSRHAEATSRHAEATSRHTEATSRQAEATSTSQAQPRKAPRPPGKECSVRGEGTSSAPQATHTTPVGNNQASSRCNASPITPMPPYNDMNTPQLKVEVKKFGMRVMPKKKMVLKMKEIYELTHPDAPREEPVAVQPAKGKSRAAKPAAPSKAVKNKQKRLPASQRVSNSDSEDDVQHLRQSSQPSNKGKGKQPRQALPSQRKNISDSEEESPRIAHPEPRPRAVPTSVQSRPHAESQPTSSRKTNDVDDEGSREASGTQSSDGSDVEDELGEVSMMIDEEEVTASQQANTGDLKQTLMRYFTENRDLYTKMLTFQPMGAIHLLAQINSDGIKCNMGKLVDFLDEQCVSITSAGSRPAKRNRQKRTKKTGARPPRK